MNARELIAELSKLDPDTLIRFSYWDDYLGDFRNKEVSEVSYDGALNETGGIDAIRVYWCQKGGGHWDDEGVCSSHHTGEYMWWSVDNLDNLPEGKEVPVPIFWEER